MRVVLKGFSEVSRAAGNALLPHYVSSLNSEGTEGGVVISF